MQVHRWLFVLTFLSSTVLLAEETGISAYWSFDKSAGSRTLESISQREDAVQGNFSSVSGVKGNAIKFDGFTTHITREPSDAPTIHEAFTFEAWIAPQAYPWNWNAIVEQKNRYFFGLDATGHIGLRVFIDDQWRECISTGDIPFMQWSYVAASFDPNAGLALYINGEQAGRLAVAGHLADHGGSFQIGRNLDPLPAAASRKVPASYSFDGILDELRVDGRVLAPDQIRAEYQASRPAGPPPLKWRKLPRIPDGGKRFGAFYTSLKFYPEWDRLWRIDDYPDLVVTFDDAPYKMVFWHGTAYNMNLVTENGRWIGDQSAEAPPDEFGCVEHMSDKQTRYAHVRLIESNPARVVIHWRYALTDVMYNIGERDPITGWGDWADEYYTIYPDGMAVRHFLVHGPRARYSITEPATLNNPGERAEDNVSIDAATLANMDGESRTFSWETWPSNGDVRGRFFHEVPNANISIINTKSDFKPVYIYEPGTLIIPYGGGAIETRSWFSKFPIWNHWPAAQIPSDGRNALALDHVSSSAITSPEPPQVRRERDGAVEGRFLIGLTDRPVSEILPLARAWLHAPELRVSGFGFESEGYSRDDRAFHLRHSTSDNGPLSFTLQGSDASPAINPSFVIDNWDKRDVSLTIDGKLIAQGGDFRLGHIEQLENSGLVLWIRGQFTRPAQFKISASSTP